MQTLVLSVVGKDLDDALSFNRLKADIKKLSSRFRLVIVHDARFQYERQTKHPFPDTPSQADLERYADCLVQLGKVFTSKLSEDLVPALQMNAHHLGLIQTEQSPNETVGRIVAVKKDVLEKQFAHNAVPILAPVTRTKEGLLSFIPADAIASRLASEIGADMIFFIDELSSSDRDRREKFAQESLMHGTRRAFVGTLTGLEAVALRGEVHSSEILLSPTT
jgi:acetylglutamate kinase